MLKAHQGSSSEVHADEHEKRNIIEAKVPPAVSGGTGPIANTSLCHELHSEKVITPTATWPPKQDPQSEIAGCLSEEPACPHPNNEVERG